MLVTQTVVDPGWIVRHVLQYGPDAEAVAPAEVRGGCGRRWVQIEVSNDVSLMQRFKRAWSALFEGVRTFFRAVFLPSKGDIPVDPDEVFSPLEDIEDLKKRFRLEERARRFGEKELPASSDTAFDGPQTQIRQHIEDHVAVAFRRANTVMERLGQALDGRAVDRAVERAERLPGEAGARNRQRARQAEKELVSLREKLREVQGRLNEFQERYGLKRNPRLQESRGRNILIATTLLVALVQAGANAALFAQGMAYGLTAGLGLAVILGLVDVVLHSLAGRSASAIQAPNASSRLRGALMLLVVLFTIPGWNLGLVHLRNGVRRFGWDQGTERWFELLTSDPLGFSDFGSFALLGIGLICSILAVVTGWYWDEPIPVMRRAGRELEDLEDEIAFWDDQKATAGYHIRAEAEATLDRIQKQVENNVRMTGMLVGRMERLEGNLRSFKRDAARSYTVLMQHYRDENRLARESPPPKYFQEEPVLKIEDPLELDLEEFRAFLEKQQDLREHLAGSMKSLHEQITRETT